MQKLSSKQKIFLADFKEVIQVSKELSQIDVKYRSKISQGHKTIRIDTDDYIALYNMAEYSELLQREQEEEHEKRRVLDNEFRKRGY